MDLAFGKFDPGKLFYLPINTHFYVEYFQLGIKLTEYTCIVC